MGYAQKNGSMLSVHAHDSDVNVIAWNKTVSYLLASGSDQGQFRVWDLRKLKDSATLGSFDWHKAPVSSIAWHPTDESVLALSSADNTISIWDLALERDDADDGQTLQDVPPQLLFLHCGQRDPKEIHFHEQIPGMIGSTGLSGLDMFISEPLIPAKKSKK